MSNAVFSSESLQAVSCWVLFSWLSLDGDDGLGLQQCTHSTLLFADEGHRIKLFLPLFCDADGVLLGIFVGDSESLLVGILDGFVDLFWMNGVPDVVEVGLVALETLWPLVREVHLHI